MSCVTKQKTVSHYDVLKVARTATLEEIRKNYQTLVLLHHPDKQSKTKNQIARSTDESDTFIRIDEAWKTLRDDRLRRIYDAELMQQTEEYFVNEVLKATDFERDEEEGSSFHTCRCGGYYILPEDSPISETIYVSCDECSLIVQVDPVQRH
uniref:J domain-containing protein n=1 Tax=Anopheles farauti TaxID=69004 RepID=A0A182QZF3_9DIPT